MANGPKQYQIFFAELKRRRVFEVAVVYGAVAFAVLQAAKPYDAVLDGRFTGGFITRHYGKPADGVHALQLELTWRNYMDEALPFAYRAEKADALKPVLRALLAELIRWAAE